MRKWLLLILFFPLTAWGAGIFSVSPSDMSMQFLATVLGTIPGTPVQTGASQFTLANGAPVIGTLFYVFNQIVFVLGLMIIVYTTIVGTLHTAQEGEFLGKSKWHPILVPLRAGFGVYLLLPSVTGYNAIQIAVMWFIVQGVGAANTLWEQVIVYQQVHQTLHNNTGSNNVNTSNLQNTGETVTGIFNANVCMLVMNKNPTILSILGEPITAFSWGNQLQWGRLSKAGQEPPLCGAISIPQPGGLFGTASITSASQSQAINSAVLGAQSILLAAAQEAVNTPGTNTLGSNAFTTAANLLQTTAMNLATTFETLDEINQQAIEDGWIMAGSYYFRLVQSGANSNIIINLAPSGMNTHSINLLLGPTLGGQTISTITSDENNYTASTSSQIASTSTGTGTTKLMLTPHTGKQDVDSIIGALFGSVLDSIIPQMTTYITTGQADPILSMQHFGAELSLGIEITFFLSLPLILALFVGTSWSNCIRPEGNALMFILAVILPIVVIVLGLLFVAGITLALYIPLIPYLVFTFCAIGWIILVIEALLGASLIALSLVVPSEDEIGKAGHAMVILLNLFLRPALMILGFVLAIQLLTIAITMLNFGFWATVFASSGGAESIGMFGMVAVIVIYVGVATTLTHEAFSLIYLLPNKILRWLGGGEESSGGDVMSKVKESKASVQKGGQIGQATMGATLKKFSPKSGGGKE